MRRNIRPIKSNMWRANRRKKAVDAEIRKILDDNRAAANERRSIASSPMWGHKLAAAPGDTVYLGHQNHIRSFILSMLDDADYEPGHVCVASPIGRALVGRHPGETIHLNTLDGIVDYTVLKII